MHHRSSGRRRHLGVLKNVRRYVELHKWFQWLLLKLTEITWITYQGIFTVPVNPTWESFIRLYQHHIESVLPTHLSITNIFLLMSILDSLRCFTQKTFFQRLGHWLRPGSRPIWSVSCLKPTYYNQILRTAWIQWSIKTQRRWLYVLVDSCCWVWYESIVRKQDIF